MSDDLTNDVFLENQPKTRTVFDSTRVLDQDELDDLLGFTDAPLSQDETPTAWTFKNDAVAAKFDDHVREQLPWYAIVGQYVADIAVSFLPTGGTLYDIGASTGNMTRLLAEAIEEKKAKAFSVEPSHQMAQRWSGKGDLFVVEAERINYKHERPDVTILFLVLMFMKPSEREDFLRTILMATNPGGAVLLVDKGFITVPEAQVACKAAHLAMKRRAGTPAESYVTKELSLRGEQRPTNSSAVVSVAENLGFVVETIFVMGEFYGLLMVRRGL